MFSLITILPMVDLLWSVVAFGNTDTATLRNWAPPNRPVRASTGVCIGMGRRCDSGRSTDGGHSQLDHEGAGGRRRRLRRTDPVLPPGAPSALLPDARFLPGCRGRVAGHA